MRPIRRLPHKAHFGKSRGAGSYAGPNVGKGSRLCENSNDRAPVYKFQSIFGPFPAITGSAERKSSLLMRRFQTISEFSHSLGRRAVGPASPRRPERPWPGAAFDPRLRHQRHGSGARCRRWRIHAAQPNRRYRLPQQTTIYGLLLTAAPEATLTIAADPGRLGAKIGITAVLHTWGSAMTQNPHS